MSIKKYQKILEHLGVDISSSEMQVFQAVLIAAGGTSRYVNYKEIVDKLKEIANKRFTKAYIYRRLNDLEEQGFITIDTIHTPRTYSISESGVA
ncbi:MAG: hypothetical protein ACFFCX_08555, partial [Candidatus Sifarchaeia archaeon]